MGGWKFAGHALEYLSRADSIPHRTEGEAALIEQLPENVSRVLDLGTGDGRLLGLVKLSRPEASGVALDFSPTMLDKARGRFAGDGSVRVVEHDLNDSLPDLGTFDAVISCFAIHHCEDGRKRELYGEVFNRETGRERGVPKSYEEQVAEARATTEQASIEEVHGALESGEDVTIIDVREPYEWEAGHIPGARLIPRGTPEDRSAEELPDRGRRIVVHCNAGGRGSLAAKSLMEMGYTNVANREGGLNAWRERGYEVE